MTERTAIITGHSGTRTLDQIRAYLPANYTADTELTEYASSLHFGGYISQTRIVIRGHDVAGWTLDGYVIPRLASGLIWAEELNQDGANG